MDIIIKNLSVTNIKGNKTENKGLQKINLTITGGTVVGIVGKDGSGKTTLAQVIAGAIKPGTGTIQIGDYDWNDSRQREFLRQQIIMIQQFPEQQIAADTIEKDIYYGLRDSELTEPQKLLNVKEALALVNMPYEEYANISPFSLTEGQKRKIAIAGVLALNPKIIILDEPTIGLDPFGKSEIIKLIENIHSNRNSTLIIISRNMDDLAKVAEKLIILDKGIVIIEGTPECILKSSEKLKRINLDIPDITKFIIKLNERINKPIPLNCFSLEDLEKEVLKRLDGDNNK